MKKYFNSFENLLAGIISIIAIVLTVLQEFNVVESVNYLLVIIGLLVTIAVYFVVSHSRRDKLYKEIRELNGTTNTNLDNIKKNVDDFNRITKDSFNEVIRSLNGVKIKTFNEVQIENYLIERILYAKERVYDLSWTGRYNPLRKDNFQIRYENSITSNKKISYREVFIFSEEARRETLKNRIDENSPQYSCRYYRHNRDILSIPKLQFAIIDNEIIFDLPWSEDNHYAIEHEGIIHILRRYFEDVWNNAIPIKEKTIIYWDQVKKILPDYEKSEQFVN